jgi:Type II restriction endonuclease EcoO109I
MQQMSSLQDGGELVGALLAPISRTRIVGEVRMVLGVTDDQARRIVEAFDGFVARPLEANLKKLNGRQLAKRNPMIYTARGTTSVRTWIDGVLADKETSAIEAHLGTFQEEVARIVSGGIKPASGVDLQVEGVDGIVRLYAIQASPNTKNSGGRKADVDALKRAAKPLRAHRRLVEMYVAVLSGRDKTAELRSEPEIQVLASDEFWRTVSGVADFRARLLRASIILADLMRKRSAHEIARIRSEALALYDDGEGGLDLEALANPPKLSPQTQPRQLELLGD